MWLHKLGILGSLAYQHHFHGDTDTLLHFAGVSGKKEMVKLLIDKYAFTKCW
jgi:hypothetical protein